MAQKRKHKHEVAVEADHFTFTPAEVAASTVHNTVAVVQHMEGWRTVTQVAAIAEPEQVARPLHDFDDIRDLLGDTEDTRNLQNSEEVINQYIEGPGHHRKTQEKRRAGQFATRVSDALLLLCVS